MTINIFTLRIFELITPAFQMTNLCSILLSILVGVDEECVAISRIFYLRALFYLVLNDARKCVGVFQQVSMPKTLL